MTIQGGYVEGSHTILEKGKNHSQSMVHFLLHKLLVNFSPHHKIQPRGYTGRSLIQRSSTFINKTSHHLKSFTLSVASTVASPSSKTMDASTSPILATRWRGD